MIVFDGSSSMNEIGFTERPEPRIDDARTAMRIALPDIAEARRLGLVLYGPGAFAGCENIYVRLRPTAQAAGTIIRELDGLDPAGMTPLTLAVEQAAEVLSYRTRPATVVLVTDGDETCGGTPCATSARMEAEARDLTVHVIAFRIGYVGYEQELRQNGMGPTRTIAECMAENTGGKVYRVETIAEFVDAMTDTLGCNLFSFAPEDKARKSYPSVFPTYFHLALKHG